MIHIQFLAPIIFSMPRRLFRRRSVNRDKYSIENTSVYFPSSWTEFAATTDTPVTLQTSIPVLPPSDVQGMRKVKHLTLSFSCEQNQVPVFYALVFVPQGYDPNTLQIPKPGFAISLYEPNQYVMSSGVLDFTGGPLRVRCPLARNLNSGDSIHLILGLPKTQQQQQIPQILSNVQYAITLQ